jgi:phosphate-selective porin
MPSKLIQWPALLGALALCAAAPAVRAQDSAALLDLLVKKGIVNDQEAEDLRADLAKSNMAALASTSMTPNLSKLVISGRIQYQFVNLNTDIAGTPADPAYVNHAFLRRIRLGFKANFGNDWSSFINYDLGSNNFDAAYIEKIFNPIWSFQAGFKKAPIGYEEYFISSGAQKAIERSTVTRYFVESNNGRRLGAGKYRQGVWVLGKIPSGLSWEFAVTNPEATGLVAGDTTGTGGAGNNGFAFWGNVGYSRPFAENQGLFKWGASYGFLPDQGGEVAGAGTGPVAGNDLAVWSTYADLRYRQFSLLGEYFGSDNERGVSATRDSHSHGYWVMASYRTGAFEPVVRYSYVDSDGRGVQLGDGIRSAASGGTHDKLSEWFFGVNWYLLGNEAKHEVKLQAGYLLGESKDVPITGAKAKATAEGFRTQLQVNF